MGNANWGFVCQKLAPLMLFGLVGCGPAFQMPNIYVEAPMVQQFNQFLYESTIRGKVYGQEKLTIKYGPMPNPTYAAFCYKSKDNKQILVDKAWWENASESAKEEVLFHELGHCVLNRGHNNQLDSFGQPISIMFWATLNVYWYETHRDQYLQELFN